MSIVFFFFDSIKIMQIKEGVNGDFSFYCWHVTEKQPKRLQLIIYKSEFTELVLYVQQVTVNQIWMKEHLYRGEVFEFGHCRCLRGRDAAATALPKVQGPQGDQAATDNPWSISLLPAGNSGVAAAEMDVVGPDPSNRGKKGCTFM